MSACLGGGRRRAVRCPGSGRACAEALSARLSSADSVLNLLARGREPDLPAPVLTPASLTLGVEPAADCARYDGLRATGGG